MRVLMAILIVFFLAGSTAPAHAAVEPLPVGPDVDYQLGGVRPVPAGVGIVVRDREARPLEGAYSVCYLNAFQTQPHERRLWRAHPRLVLRRHGRPVVDQAWGERLLDTRTRVKRVRISRIVGRWIEGCAAAGFEAVELDNLDSWTRSQRLLRPRHNRALARLLVGRAHRAGLAVAQKNWAEWNGRRAGFDFAIAEECGRWRECGSYVANYGRRVLVVEYLGADFDRVCARWGDQLAIVLRDRELRRGGARRWC